jgi:hypothetical protein
MSVLRAEAVFVEALSILSRQHLPEMSQEDLLAALTAGRPGPLAFLYEAGAEVSLPHQQLVSRATAIYFFFCAGNLSDDLSDGDCTYLTEPSRLGPCTQLTLQNLFFQTLLEADLPSRTLSQAIRELIQAVGQQHIELRTKQWTASVFREVAEGIAGRQWSAYLQILWCDTKLASRAATIGMNAGTAAHVALDIKSQDPRYTTMPEADKREIVNWAVETTGALRKENLRCIDAVLRSIDPVLKGAS